MKKVKITEEGIARSKRIFGVEPYRIISHPRSKESMERDLASERMRIANEIVNNLTFIEDDKEDSA